MTTGRYTIVPLALKNRRLKIDFSQVFWGNLHSCWITPGVKPGLDAKPRCRRRTSDQIDNRLMAYQRSASPILRDKGKHSVLNLVPLARGESGTLVQRQLINTRDSFSIIFRITIRLFFGGSYSLLLLVKRRKGCI
jgi:hypothetical protein